MAGIQDSPYEMVRFAVPKRRYCTVNPGFRLFQPVLSCMEVSKEHMASEANMADETNNYEATELVGDHVETVDVS